MIQTSSASRDFKTRKEWRCLWELLDSSDRQQWERLQESPSA